MGMGNVVSFAGLFLLMVVAWSMSRNRRVVNWRVLGWGLGLQLLFGAFVFWFPPGRKAFLLLNDLVNNILGYTSEGSTFVFGRLAVGPPAKESLGVFVAFQVFPTVLVFSALMGLLYHIGVMQLLIRAFSRVFTGLMRISGAEALCVSSNVFVGVESALAVRPFLLGMTRSELLTILTAGMATIASTALGLYVMFLNGVFPSIAGHLISASLLTAPAAVIMAKLFQPEVDTPETLGQVVEGDHEPANNWMEAVIRATMEGVKLAVGIAAMLIVFISLLAMANGLLGWVWAGMNIETLLGYLFYPLVLLMGVSPDDAMTVAMMLGKRTVATEIPSYQQLAMLVKSGGFHDPRSITIASYALCGFAHIPAVAIFVGGLAAVEPRRAKDLGALGMRALVAATLACMMTGALAGVFSTGNDGALLKPKASVVRRQAASPQGTKTTTRPAARSVTPKNKRAVPKQHTDKVNVVKPTTTRRVAPVRRQPVTRR